jgi:hypothetical protein
VVIDGARGKGEKRLRTTDYGLPRKAPQWHEDTGQIPENHMKRVRRTVYSWPAIERMTRLHRLIENREYPNCHKIAKEFEMSVRTIKRDVDFMKTRLNLPIE